MSARRSVTTISDSTGESMIPSPAAPTYEAGDRERQRRADRPAVQQGRHQEVGEQEDGEDREGHRTSRGRGPGHAWLTVASVAPPSDDSSAATGGPRPALRAVYTRRRCRPTRTDPPSVVAYAGEPGAFAEDAVLAAFGDVAREPIGSFRQVFEAVTGGRAQAGVVPIENVINGTVRETYDLLLEHDLVIRGRGGRAGLAGPGGPARPAHRGHRAGLLAHPGARPGRGLPPLATVATADDLQHGRRREGHRRRGERAAAAVLSPRAAALFGLEVLADGIGDLPDNRTRFVVIARPDAPPLGTRAEGSADRTTLVVAVRNEPGTLLAVLQVIAAHRLNMHKLESRPSRERAWEYVFWIDLDGDVAEPGMTAALAELEGVTTMRRVLGSYPAAPGG